MICVKKIISCWVFIILLCIFLGCPPGYADDQLIEDIVQKTDSSFSCSYDGVKHSFILDLPESREDSPLVVMLPGYGNTAEAFRTAVHFEEGANALGYAVVYVTGAPDPNSPGSAIGWHSDPDTAGNKDSEFLAALVKYLQEEYALDREHAYAVGFSNGAFMTHRLAIEADGTFSAFVSVAGLMPKGVWDARRERNEISFFQITGEKDDVVPKNSDGSARFAAAPAIEDVMEYWAESTGLSLLETDIIGSSSVLTKYRSEEKPQQVWHLLVKGGRHSWPSEQYNGINTNALILEFFEAQK